jgi:hypothetical protein
MRLSACVDNHVMPSESKKHGGSRILTPDFSVDYLYTTAMSSMLSPQLLVCLVVLQPAVEPNIA